MLFALSNKHIPLFAQAVAKRAKKLLVVLVKAYRPVRPTRSVFVVRISTAAVANLQHSVQN